MKTWHTVYIVIAFGSLFGSQALANDEVNALVHSEMQANNIPGLAVAIVLAGEVIKLEVYGQANIEQNVPVTANSVFELASLTKQFTAAAILMLIADGKLGLDDPVTTYIDDTPPGWENIQIRHLLTHTAGLADRFEETVNGRSIMDHSATDMLRSAVETQMIGAPGEQWQYSDQGYFVLGYIIEQVSGHSYEDFVRNRIFEPSGMDATFIHDKYAIVPNRVAGYELDEGNLRNIRRDWQFDISSHFGVMSSIEDMTKWEQSLVENTALSDEQLQELWSPEWSLHKDDEFEMSYGFGWYVGNLKGRIVLEHTGITGTSYLRDVENDLAVIVLSNLGFYDVSRLGRKIAKIMDPSIPFPDAAL